jgi:hypothetical protein
MAVEIDKESFELSRSGTTRINRRYLADSRSEALSGIPKVVDGLPLAGIRGSIWISKDDGRHVVEAVYEGLVDDPDESLDEFDIVTEEREQKIEAFRPRGILLTEYDGSYDAETGRLIFPPTMPKPKTRLGQPLTLDSMRGDSETPNPLWNATSYSVEYSMATWRLVRKKVPQSLVKQSRTVIDRLPSGFEESGPKKQWYVRPLQKRKVGNAWTMEWSAIEISEFTDMQVLLALRAAETKK